jgi:lipid-binding SYLF domain-containing protein
VIDITEVVIVLNSDEAVKAFSRGGNVTVGGEARPSSLKLPG